MSNYIKMDKHTINVFTQVSNQQAKIIRIKSITNQNAGHSKKKNHINNYNWREKKRIIKRKKIDLQASISSSMSSLE